MKMSASLLCNFLAFVFVYIFLFVVSDNTLKYILYFNKDSDGEVDFGLQKCP